MDKTTAKNLNIIFRIAFLALLVGGAVWAFESGFFDLRKARYFVSDAMGRVERLVVAAGKFIARPAVVFDFPEFFATYRAADRGGQILTQNNAAETAANSGVPSMPIVKIAADPEKPGDNGAGKNETAQIPENISGNKNQIDTETQTQTQFSDWVRPPVQTQPDDQPAALPPVLTPSQTAESRQVVLCNYDLGESECVAAGGAIECGVGHNGPAVCKCLCPNLSEGACFGHGALKNNGPCCNGLTPMDRYISVDADGTCDYSSWYRGKYFMCALCGDGACDGTAHENKCTCPADCV